MLLFLMNAQKWGGGLSLEHELRRGAGEPLTELRYPLGTVT